MIVDFEKNQQMIKKHALASDKDLRHIVLSKIDEKHCKQTVASLP